MRRRLYHPGGASARSRCLVPHARVKGDKVTYLDAQGVVSSGLPVARPALPCIRTALLVFHVAVDMHGGMVGQQTAAHHGAPLCVWTVTPSPSTAFQANPPMLVSSRRPLGFNHAHHAAKRIHMLWLRARQLSSASWLGSTANSALFGHAQVLNCGNSASVWRVSSTACAAKPVGAGVFNRRTKSPR